MFIIDFFYWFLLLFYDNCRVDGSLLEGFKIFYFYLYGFLRVIIDGLRLNGGLFCCTWWLIDYFLLLTLRLLLLGIHDGVIFENAAFLNPLNC